MAVDEGCSVRQPCGLRHSHVRADAIAAAHDWAIEVLLAASRGSQSVACISYNLTTVCSPWRGPMNNGAALCGVMPHQAAVYSPYAARSGLLLCDAICPQPWRVPMP